MELSRVVPAFCQNPPWVSPFYVSGGCARAMGPAPKEGPATGAALPGRARCATGGKNIAVAIGLAPRHVGRWRTGFAERRAT